MLVIADHAKRQYLVKFALGSSLAEAKVNTVTLKDPGRQRIHYAHMTLEEVFDATSTASPYGGGELAQKVDPNVP